jgi:hypothetical protein
LKCQGTTFHIKCNCCIIFFAAVGVVKRIERGITNSSGAYPFAAVGVVKRTERGITNSSGAYPLFHAGRDAKHGVSTEGVDDASNKYKRNL